MTRTSGLIATTQIEIKTLIAAGGGDPPDLAGLCRQADIIVAAVGAAGLVRGDWVSPGAVVIDVGMNRTAEGTLTGDVVFDELRERCAALTPVPGGVGPMTVAMLMYNTLQAYLAGAAAS